VQIFAAICLCRFWQSNIVKHGARPHYTGIGHMVQNSGSTTPKQPQGETGCAKGMYYKVSPKWTYLVKPTYAKLVTMRPHTTNGTADKCLNRHTGKCVGVPDNVTFQDLIALEQTHDGFVVKENGHKIVKPWS